MLLTIRAFQPADENAVIDIWADCDLLRPQNDPHRDIQLKLQVQPELFLVGELDSKIVAVVMAGYEGHRGWLNYLAVIPDQQGYGYGRDMVEAAVEKLEELGCPKINLQIRSSNSDVIYFYERLGFVMEEVICMGRRL